MFLRSRKIKKNVEQSGKNPQNYAVGRNESFSFDQNPLEINIFNDEEEAEIKKRVEKRKMKRQEVIKRSQGLKQQ